MDTQLTHTISGAMTFMNSVDKRTQRLLQTTHANNEILKDIDQALKKLRKTLTSLSQSLKQDGFKKSILTELSTERASLFNYISTVLLATINCLQKLEAEIKRATGSKSLFSKKSKTPGAIDDDIAIYETRIEHLNLALSVALNIIDCDSLTSNRKLHIHEVKTHIGTLADVVAQLQTSNLNLSISTPDKMETPRSSTPYLTDFNGICSNATELAQAAIAKTNEDAVKVHSGFVPMSPLVEVLTKNTLQPCPTIESVFELER